jgi:DDB1- and CUL4-associated factor 5
MVIQNYFSGDAIDVFFHNKPVYGLSVNPENDNIFSTAGEDGE